MLFLKQIHATGFKSFADPTTIVFDKDMIGVVGPNGSGKSNITDSIRWALGEQSNKSLRGSNIDDFIFSGSSDRPAADFAEVTLVFDNKRDIFTTLATDIVEIKRRFTKKNRESEFFINGTKCKLRDVQDIALETGLTKSSIAIISQGTIANFAEAKPDVRREIFDEAAGVGRYKKRKAETQRRLDKTNENLIRVNDIAEEIERRLPTLKRKAEKAEKYAHLAEELKSIELAILAKDSLTYEVELEKLRIAKTNLEYECEKISSEINLYEEELNEIISKNSASDKEMNLLTDNFKKVLERISSLKLHKQKIDAKDNNDDSFANIDDIKAKNIQKDFDEKTISINIEKDAIKSFEMQLFNEKKRYDEIAENFSKVYNKRREIDDLKQSLKYRLEHLNYKKTSTIISSSGAKMIIDNKNRLSGVIGTVGSLITVAPEHQIAISLLTGNHLNSVVFKTDLDAKNSIEFLKRNNYGRINALPINTLNPSQIIEAQKQVIRKAPGFVGFANELIKISDECQVILDYIYGTSIVTDKFDDAIKLGKNINFRYGIVSLDGQRVLSRGAMSGGSVSANTNIFAEKRVDNNSDPEYLQKQIQNFDQNLDLLQKELSNLREAKQKSQEIIGEYQASIRLSNLAITSLDSNIELLKENYQILTRKTLTGEHLNDSLNETESIRISKEIAKLEAQRNEISIKMNTFSTSRTQNSDRQYEIAKKNKQKTTELLSFKDKLANVRTELSMMENKNLEVLKKLQEKYNLSLDSVRQMKFEDIENVEETRIRILELTRELKEIGDVSFESIKEYKDEKERFDYYYEQSKDIQEAVDKMIKIISDIDIEMKTQFQKIIDDVNNALPEAFKKLFNGGGASLIYTDPENILETGIDIEVNPPGKKISNLNLLSGGEKSLVALSVLFSILKVRPLPIVILDEAEAPLDAANVTRFAKYVREFLNFTQFIIVTHREGTMENCDALFGITMQTKGITKLAKLDFNWDSIRKFIKN